MNENELLYAVDKHYIDFYGEAIKWTKKVQNNYWRDRGFITMLYMQE